MFGYQSEQIEIEWKCVIHMWIKIPGDGFCLLIYSDQSKVILQTCSLMTHMFHVHVGYTWSEIFYFVSSLHSLFWNEVMKAV